MVVFQSCGRRTLPAFLSCSKATHTGGLSSFCTKILQDDISLQQTSNHLVQVTQLFILQTFRGDMRTIIIERSTKIEVADCSTLEKALLIAFRRQVANSDMLFVVGSTDINLHRFAISMHKEFSKLIELHRKYKKMGFKVDLAPERRDLWRRIAESREVRYGHGSAKPLSESIGTELASDVELLMRLKNHPRFRIAGIDRTCYWTEAYSQAAKLSNQYRIIKFNLLIHELLGVLVIAADDLVADSDNFVAKQSFGPQWKQK